MPDIGDILKTGAKNAGKGIEKGVKAVGKGIEKGADFTQKRAKMHFYIKGILRAPRRLTVLVNRARSARQRLKNAEKRAFAKFNKNTQMIVNALSGASKLAYQGAGKLVGDTVAFGLRFLGPDKGTQIYRNGVKSGVKMLAKGAHGLTHLSLLGLRGAYSKVYVRVKTTQQRKSYKAMRDAVLKAM